MQQEANVRQSRPNPSITTVLIETVSEQLDNSTESGLETMKNNESRDLTDDNGDTLRSNLSSVLNLVNSICGAGIVAIPGVYPTTGIVLGIIMTILAATLAGITLYMLLILAKKTETCSFTELSEYIFPRERFRKYSSEPILWTIVIESFGVVSIFWSLIAEILPITLFNLFGSSFFQEPIAKWVILSSICIFIVLPLCMTKEIDKLRYTSGFALMAIIYLIVLLLFVQDFIHNGPVESSVTSTTQTTIQHDQPIIDPFPHSIGPSLSILHFILAIPIIIFSFAAHQVALPIYQEIKPPNPSSKRLKLIVSVSFGVILVFYISIGLAGYSAFGSSTTTNILINLGYPPPLNHTLYPNFQGVRSWSYLSTFIYIGQLMFCLVLCFSIPITFFPLRLSVFHLLERKKLVQVDHHDVVPVQIHGQMTNERSNSSFYLWTISIMCLSVLVALVIPSSLILFDLVSSLGVSILVFIFPSLCWLGYIASTLNRTFSSLKELITFKYSQTQAQTMDTGDCCVVSKGNYRSILLARFLLSFGIVFFLVGTGSTILGIIDGYGQSPILV